MHFLCLHGTGTSAKIFEFQMAHIKSNLPGQHEFTFLDGCIECIDDFFPGPYYCYCDLPTSEQGQEVFNLIAETIEEDGPFDGIIGFSEGAAVAASYILNDLYSSEPTNPFKCAVFFCAIEPFDSSSRPFCINKDGSCRFADTGSPMVEFDPSHLIPQIFDDDWSSKYDENTQFWQRYTSSFANLGGTQITIPTTHILSVKDGFYQQSCVMRDLCTTQGRHVFEHLDGHQIPTDSNSTAKMVMTIQNMLQDVLVG